MAALVAALLPGIARPAGLIVSLGAEADSADSSACSVAVDAGLTESTWLTATAAVARTERDIFDLRTRYADLGIDHFFDPVGIRLAGGYWGKDGFLESADLRASLYLRGRGGSLSADYERRNLDLTIDAAALDQPRVIPFSAEGYGLRANLSLGERMSVHAGGMRYDYSRDIALQPRIDLLRLFTLSRLSLMNSLIDYRVSGGVEWAFGLRRVDLLLARWKTAVDQGRVDSVGAGFLTPIGRSADLEIRLARDESDTYGSATVVSLFVYLFRD